MFQNTSPYTGWNTTPILPGHHTYSMITLKEATETGGSQRLGGEKASPRHHLQGTPDSPAIHQPPVFEGPLTSAVRLAGSTAVWIQMPSRLPSTPFKQPARSDWRVFPLHSKTLDRSLANSIDNTRLFLTVSAEWRHRFPFQASSPSL